MPSSQEMNPAYSPAAGAHMADISDKKQVLQQEAYPAIPPLRI